MAVITLPDDPAFDSSRLAWNLAADQHPAAIAVASTVEDVIEAVTWAREKGLRIAAQTTGHGAVALPDLSQSLLLKTALFDDNVEIDTSTATARIPAGAKLGDVIDAAAERGFTVLHGSSPTVGAIGYLLGGGLTMYGRSHGLACNRVVSFEVVTENGEKVTADSVTNPDLFWALRGGGGGLGVVTSAEIELIPMSEVFAGSTFWAAAAAPQVLDAWIGWTRNAPESATTTFRILRLPPIEEIPEPLRGQTVACIDGICLDQTVGEELAGLLDSVAPPLLGGWGIQPVAELARLHGDPEDPVPARGDSTMLNGLDEAAGRALIEAVGEAAPTDLIVAEIRHLGGALARPAEDGGSLDHLEGEYLLFATGIAAGPDMTAKTMADLDQLFAAMRPWSTPVRFLSFTERDFELADCLPADNLDRLRGIHDQYSPDRTFTTVRSIDA